MKTPRPLATLDAAPARARSVARASATSDLLRPRDLAVAALAGALALAAGLAMAPKGTSIASPGPLGRPHAQANLACSACHADRADRAGAAAACAGCHGTTAHTSTRAAHRALAAKGELRCVDCHAAHGSAQGVTFLGGDRYVRWGAGSEVGGGGVQGPPRATVVVVAASACARCHDLDERTDPIASCLAPAADATGPRAVTCFDEHQRADTLPRVTGVVCAAQHGPARFAAWDAARQVLSQSAWVAPARRPPLAPLGLATAAASLAFVTIGVLRRRRRADDKAAGPSAPLAPAALARLPQINTSTCVGCYACVDACPFDVLEIQRYVAVVARPADCCGVVLCAQVCPNGSLTIAEGEPVEVLPRLDEHLESLDRPGVFVAGDLSGLPLIKNAIRQGARVIDRIAEKRGSAWNERLLDVIIIGAGPAGLSASLRAEELGLRYVTLEQGTVASSIRSFPRHKLVYDQPLDLPVHGELWLKECTKEELLAEWTRIVRRRKLAIREQHRVTDLAAGDGFQRVTFARPDGAIETLDARALVLAIGKRGTPRRLECAIDPDANVFYSLADARSFAGQRVVVVGLGDSAMEAAVAIARQPGTQVTISYRGSGFQRGKARNVAELRTLRDRGRVRIVLESTVTRVERGRVTLDVSGRAETVDNDAVLALIGGLPSGDLVERAGVKLHAAARDAS